MNTLLDCPFCVSPLTLGIEICYDSEKNLYARKSSNKESKACETCYREYCYFCNDVSFDSCISCNKDYCKKCADKWYKETGLSFMYGDHNVCKLCFKDKK